MVAKQTNMKSCPLCRNDNFKPFRFGLIRCLSCGLIVDPLIYNPHSNKAFQEIFFAENYYKDSFWVRRFEAWNNFKTGIKILRLKLPGTKVLEIGPGSGSFLIWLKNHGFEPMACDLSPQICEHLGKLGFNVHCGPLYEMDGKGFDLIIMKHVLEHLNDPLDFLKAVKNRLDTNGIVYVVVPNITCWEARFSGWNSYEPYHLSYFAPSSLRYAVEKAGLKVESIVTRESFSGWFLAFIRTLMKFQRKREKPFVERAPFVNRPLPLETAYRLATIIAGIFTFPLRRIQAGLGYGDEIILIAQRVD